MNTRILSTLVAVLAGLVLLAAPIAASAQAKADSTDAKQQPAAKARKAGTASPQPADAANPKPVNQSSKPVAPASLRNAPVDQGSDSDCHHSKASDA